VSFGCHFILQMTIGWHFKISF